MTQKSLSENPKFRWCSCGHGQIHALGGTYAEKTNLYAMLTSRVEQSPAWRCLSCGKQNCFICREADCDHLRDVEAKNKQAMKHMASALFSKSKEERQAQRQLRAADAATKEEEARTCKRCPWGACRAPIQKDPNGCAHMTCEKCRTQFCWCCKVIWRNGVPQHLTGCVVSGSRAVARTQLNMTGYAEGWDKDEGYDPANDGRRWLPANQQ